MLAFVAYQLWGTALFEHNAQAHLRSQYEARVGHQSASNSVTDGSADTPTISGSGTTTTSPAAAALEAQAPPVGNALGLLSIPRIGMNDDAIVEGVGEAQLEEGPGHYPGTPLPGQPGNVAIAGHRTTYGAPFYNLDQLQVGDPIFIQVPQGTFQYDVIRSTVVSPSDTAVLDAAPLPILTLTTCNPRYSASTRLVVTALLQGVQAPPPAAVDPPATPTSATTTPAAQTATTHSPPSTELASDASSHGSTGGAVFWGELTLLAFFVVRILWRLVRKPERWGILSVGSPIVLLALFVFFEHVSLALPASF